MSDKVVTTVKNVFKSVFGGDYYRVKKVVQKLLFLGNGLRAPTWNGTPIFNLKFDNKKGDVNKEGRNLFLKFYRWRKRVSEKELVR